MAKDEEKIPNPGIPGWDGPEESEWDTKDYPRIDPDKVNRRLIAVSHRAGVILHMLQANGIPTNRFTHEALLLAAEQLGFLLDVAEEGE